MKTTYHHLKLILPIGLVTVLALYLTVLIVKETDNESDIIHLEPQVHPKKLKSIKHKVDLDMEHPMYWKTIDLEKMKIPVEAFNAKDSIQVQAKRVQIQGINMFYRDANPPASYANGETFVLLHGMAFKSQTWLELGTINLLAAIGNRVIAVDLPGYGETQDLYHGNKAVFINDFLKELKLGKVFIVSPSMSGQYAIPFLLNYPSSFRGYIPIAPVQTDEIVNKAPDIQVPTLIIYGSKDTGLGHQSRDNLKPIPKSKVVELPNAGHPAYLDQPQLFHTLLFNFIHAVKNDKQSATL